MNVKELIEELSKYPEETLCVFRSNEGGYNEAVEVRTICLRPTTNIGLLYGSYDYEQELLQPNAIEIVAKSKKGQGV